MKTTYPMGSVSSGTMRTEDLLSEFASMLRHCLDTYEPAGAMARDWRKSFEDLLVDADAVEDYEGDEAHEILGELFDALDAFAAPYFYFGAHPGDGSDYGFWLHDDFQQVFRDDGGLEVSDLSEVPADYTGEVLDINDHGNATLYSANRGELAEVWSVV